MSRPWVKLDTGILDHFELDTVSPLAFKVYVKALALAGDVDDDGRIGCPRKVAWRFRMDESELLAAVQELDGRIAEEDGQLYVRDWLDQQPPSRKREPRDQVAERKRRQRERERLADVTQTSRMRDTNGHVPAGAPSRGGHAALEVEVEVEQEQEPPLTPPVTPVTQPDATTAGGKPPAGPASTNGNGPPPDPNARDGPATAWAPFEHAVSESLGGVRVRNQRTGRPLAWVGELCSVAGRHSANDVTRAVDLWRQFAASDEWRYRPRDSTRLAASFGAWCASSGVPFGRETERPERRSAEVGDPERWAAVVALRKRLTAEGKLWVPPQARGSAP